jgi:hypothetical protein
MRIGHGPRARGDRGPRILGGSRILNEGNTGAVNANFTVTLSAASGEAVTVDYAAADDTATAPGDYSLAPATLTFTAGQRTKTVTVTVKGDMLDEVYETYAVTLASATNATVGDGTGVGTITDDDPTPTLTVADLSVAEGNAGTANATFAVTLSPSAVAP